MTEITPYQKAKALADMVTAPVMDLHDIAFSEQHYAVKARAMLAQSRMLTKRLELYCKTYEIKES